MGGLEDVRSAPADAGPVRLIVARPAVGERALPEVAQLDPSAGLVGDGWRERGSRHTPDGAAEPDRQLTLMSARAAALFAASDDPAAWAPAGDQLYVDLDLSVANLPPGTRLDIGTACIEITAAPHTGCAKFVQRFGEGALRLVSSPEGKSLRLRGVNARVVEAGAVRVGDVATKRQP